MTRKDTETDVAMETTGAKAETAAKTESKAAAKKSTPEESVYTAEELANSAGTVFKTRKECVAAALKAANVTESTVAEAKKIVEKFLKKEVK